MKTPQIAPLAGMTPLGMSETTKPAKKAPSLTKRAKALAEKTADAYSADAYTSWSSVCRMLLARGYSEREAEAILRSKWTRWAGDMESRGEGCTAKTLEHFLDLRTSGSMFRNDDDLKRQVAELVAETFGAPDPAVEAIADRVLRNK